MKPNLILLATFCTIIFLIPPATAQSENSCVDCHKNPETVSTLPDWQQENFDEWEGSIHASNDITCDKCHGGDPKLTKKELSHEGVKDSSNPESSIYYKNIPKTCGNCHADVYDEFKKSAMYHNLESDKLAPTCATCMGSHAITVVDMIKISKKCSLCHNEMMGIRPEIPNEAERILLLQQEVKSELLKAKSAVKQAKDRNKDVKRAEEAMQEATSRLEKSGSEWHRFRTIGFEREMLDALYYSYKANNLAYESMAQTQSLKNKPSSTRK
ncbi:MAG: hypothetical protein V3R86_05445, partial [Candidatus Hydrothermarchaeaceae archaeon]